MFFSKVYFEEVKKKCEENCKYSKGCFMVNEVCVMMLKMWKDVMFE